MKPPNIILNTITSICGALLLFVANNINQRLDRIEKQLETMVTHSYRIEQIERRLHNQTSHEPRRLPTFLQLVWIKQEDDEETV